MSARLTAFAAALLLGACATAQENPNYQYSSKYGGADTGPSAMPVQTVTYSPGYQSAETQTVTTLSQPTVIATQQTTQTTVPVSPTEQAYNPETMVGTPGYSVYVPEDSGLRAETSQGSRPVTYDYSDNVSVVASPSAGMTGAVPPGTRLTAPSYASDQSYTVKPGDTIYSMSRSLCVDLEDIMRPNGIGDDYAISIGQQLVIPASRC